MSYPIQPILANTEALLKLRHDETLTSTTPQRFHDCLGQAVMMAISKNWTESKKRREGHRKAYYLSAEYLMGRLVYSNLFNMGILHSIRRAFAEKGVDLAELEDIEDAALGNGGLGRLAACFLDSAVTKGIPLSGYGLRYRFGLFKQSFDEAGNQKEMADDWTRYGDPWSYRREKHAVKVTFADQTVIAMPYDMPILGYHTDNIGTLRLWQCEPEQELDFDAFNAQDYEKALLEKNNFSVDAVYDGQEALDEMAEGKVPDVMLLDIRMPGMNGVVTTGEVKKKYPSVKVLMLTTFDDSDYILSALNNGACGYLLKDIGANALIEAIKNAVDIPLVADIHFNHRIALACVDAGVDKIRLNPGNIGGDDHVKEVAAACKAKNIPIRIGVNAGSLEKEVLAKYGAPVPEALVESAMYHVSLLEKYDFDNIVISIKSSNVPRMMEAYRLLSERCDYPLHVGVTEAGTYRMGLIKSGMGIGGLLMEGLGDTLRVSLTDEPEKEVQAGFDILRAAGHAVGGPEIISCPTCGRTRIDLIGLAQQVEERLKDCRLPLTVAVMGCAVNGPGEAREADIGIAGGDGCAILFKKGEIIRKIPEDRVVEELAAEIEQMELHKEG